MEAIFSLKICGSYRVYLYAEPERFDTMIIWESMRIRNELNTNWYDAVGCNMMQHDGDTMQYEAVRWWWRINRIALWCDENTIGTNRNLHEPMRTCAIQYDNTIIAHRIAAYWVVADKRRIPVRMYNESIRMYNDEIRTNRNWHELIRRSAMQYDAIRIGSIRRANTNVLNISKHSYWPANYHENGSELIGSNSNQYGTVRCATNANSYWFADNIRDSGTGALQKIYRYKYQFWHFVVAWFQSFYFLLILFMITLQD